MSDESWKHCLYCAQLTGGRCWRHQPLHAPVVMTGETTVSIDTDQRWEDAGCPSMQTLLDENTTLREQVARLQGALEPLLELPYEIDPATVPKTGVDAAPEQVIGTLHISLAKMRRLRAALGETGEDNAST